MYLPCLLRHIYQPRHIINRNVVLLSRGEKRYFTQHISRLSKQICHAKAARFGRNVHQIIPSIVKPNFKLLGIFLLYPSFKNILFHTASCEKLKLSHHHGNRTSFSKDLILKRREPRFNWRLFWELVEPDILLLIVAAITAFAVALVNIKIPILLGDLANTITELIKDNKADIFKSLYPPCKRLIWNYILQSSLTCFYITALTSFGERLSSRMRIQLFKSLMEQDVAFFDAQKSGDIINRLTTDIQDFKSSFKQIISQGLRSTTQIIGCGITLYSLSPKLTSLMMLILPGIILVGTGLGKLLREISRKAQDQVSVALAVADEAIGNIRTVRAFAMEPKEIGWYTSEIHKAQFYSELLGGGIGVFQGLTNLAINGIVLVVLYAGSILINNNELRTGDLMSYLVATQTVQRSLATMSILFGQIVRGMSAGSRAFEFMEMRPSIKLCGGKKISKEKSKGNIRLENIKFSYPTRPDHVVIENMNLDIKAGKVIALCGPSGSGKTTIAALIERFYDVDNGSIKIDGVDIRELDPAWVRGDLIGYINQEPVLFATSVFENIRYGSPNATYKEVYEAAKKANADDFIRGFPHGYDTVIGERGATVSGGQKQRIAIARALLKNPKILILDEATSALDAESERIVQNALNKLIKGRTVIIIAHRLSTIQNADTIAVMSNGKIQEMGTHQVLMDKNGIYADLVRRQTPDDSES